MDEEPRAPLGFYDCARQGYRDGPLNEFWIGDYKTPGAHWVGEFRINLYGSSAGIHCELCVYPDAFGALHLAAEAGVLSALEIATIHTPDDLTELLLACGLQDVSREPAREKSAA